ncbi:DNA mismatch repair protein MutS2 [Oikeobacillus pervagus]|uniref:Endonuclease MutS2 n=1 Tax=Oikeobacillus pervagus TaxID=1325931 RepID=A0AAJ1SZ05_9BACI|nr:endonuclease MutS2 [Oikeobacillus pervagus]MDQ0215449.1 DNA mismatch repair protein MutS2 [Oikeobacillus pervagus]
MNKKVLSTLEFYKIKELLKEYASSSLGKEKVDTMIPATSYEEVVRLQDETDEAVQALRLTGHAPLSGIYDIRAHVKRAQIGGMLNGGEFVQIGSTIHAGRMMKRYIVELIEEKEIDLPILSSKEEQLPILISLHEEIKQAIDENGDVLDSASDTLRHLRSQLRTSEGRIREKLEGMIRSKNAQKMLSDAIVTIRNDRYVIPVKQEYRSHYGGIIHDQSASGQTLFIEPESVVQLNNQLREIKLKEQEEIERILFRLTGFIDENADELFVLVRVLSDLDFVFAKAKYGKTIKASKPSVNERGYIRLVQARHPLIPLEEVVANNIELGNEFTAIVITGPNTGGKTVTLKTVGLAILMAQAGLQIPVGEGSEIGVFQSVFADIGDEQSIEQSLSTFSSHMVNIVDILKEVDANSLVLFDELGAGTDPQEGAALAIAILDEVHDRGARIIATTHYPELKAYGYNRDGVVNASVEFNVETLSPTYRLLIGVPGRSNAFEISKKLGLQEWVIERARKHIGTDTNEVENMIASLERSKKLAEQEEKEAKEYLKHAEKLQKELQKQMIEFYEHKDEMIANAERKAKSLVEKAQEESEEVIRDLRKLRLQKNAEVKEHELIEARKRLSDAVPSIAKSNMKKVKKKLHSYQPGDEVKVVNFDQKGHLVEKVSDNEWLVQMGIMKMKVKESNLEFIKSDKKAETKPLATVRGRDYHVKLELDLRGERYEDALLKVEKYIDDAILAGYPRVSIIHGKGTGALRKGVQQYLKNHRSVKGTRLGEAGEGGSGVTVVELK